MGAIRTGYFGGPTQQPRPLVYPACKTCGVPYILRLGFLVAKGGGGQDWAWFRDCKHRALDNYTIVDERPKKPRRVMRGMKPLAKIGPGPSTRRRRRR